MITFLLGLLTGFILTYFTPKLYNKFVFSGIDGGKRKAIQKGIETVTTNQN